MDHVVNICEQFLSQISLCSIIIWFAIHNPVPDSIQAVEQLVKIKLDADASAVVSVAAPLTQVVTDIRKTGAINLESVGLLYCQLHHVTYVIVGQA